MKRHLLKELKTKTRSELSKILNDYTNDLQKISLQLKSGKLKNVMLAKQKRKDIACILTIMKEMEEINV